MDLFLSLNGRIGRGKFWLGLIVLIVAQFVLSTILGFAGLMSVDPATGQPEGAGFWIAIIGMMVLFIWPSICIYGKRFHDRDKSAWWMLIALIPIIGAIWLLIECGLLKGTDGPNRFGEDPVPN
jgi:uncharacterized membrane protein YhaH (DUF805 family)